MPFNGNLYYVKIEGKEHNYLRRFILKGQFENNDTSEYDDYLEYLPEDGSSNYIFKIYGDIIDDPVEFWKIYDNVTKNMNLTNKNGWIIN